MRRARETGVENIMTKNWTRFAQVFLVCFCLAALVPLSRLIVEARTRNQAIPAKASVAPAPVKRPTARPAARPHPANA
jgi:hypothetical protein